MAGANRLCWPRRGSLQVWPRVRAKKLAPRIRSWARKDSASLMGFIGYKTGMTHVLCKDNNPHSITKGQQIFIPVTIVSCPPMLPVSLRFYKKGADGLKLVSEVFSDKMDKKYFKPIKSQGKETEFDLLKLVVHTHPKLIGSGQKKPNVLELKISGKNNEETLKIGKGLLQKEIKVGDVFKDGQLVDVHAVSKGKGFQGTVKRFGVKIRQHKSEKVKRGIGTLGPWRPRHVLFSVAQPGKMGFHTRMEYNKQIMKIGTKSEEINPKGGFVGYGNVRTEYLMLRGTIPGARKRLIVMTEPLRPMKNVHVHEVTYINKGSQQ